jgi:hypothetical protein
MPYNTNAYDFYIQRQENFNFLKILKLVKFLQRREGCMYYMIVMSSINLDPY